MNPAPLDYAAWLDYLRGASVPPLCPPLEGLVSDETLDYVKRTEHKEYLINNIALLQVDPRDPGRLFYDIELPRTSDVVADLRSSDPRVALTVRIGDAELEPSNSFLLVAAQYRNMHARMSFSLDDLKSGGLETVGFAYTTYYFQIRHRVKIAAGNVFAGPVLYKDGMTSSYLL